MLHALEQIRRMRGGAPSHLMRCSDGLYYVVKFQNNPQHRRMLGTKLAARLGLPTVPVAIVEVSEDLIRLTPELTMELPRSRIPCQPGPQFGSRYPGDPRQLTLHDFLPDEQLREVENLHAFAGMLVFDKWACNTNGRQTVFFRRQNEAANDAAAVRYETRMIDQGFCFNAGEWNFPDAPLRGLYARNRAYRVLRYSPNLVRDEWVNIGVLLFDPLTGERRLRMIEEEDEFRRVRRLHPGADELLLRAIRDDLEDRFQSASANGGKGQAGNWQQLLAKWDETLSNALQQIGRAHV